MHQITLICSAHRENGRCNAEELLKILLAIEPEVVSLEIQPSDNGTVEAQALIRYRELKPCQSVHVDRYQIPTNFTAEIKNGVDRVFDCVAQRSEEYGRLEKENADGVNQNGFSYLNNSTFATKLARMAQIEDETITGTHDQGLIHALQWLRQAMHSRELQMVGNINEYCRKNAFDVGVFLVGAAHKAGIGKEVEKYIGAEVNPINWGSYGP